MGDKIDHLGLEITYARPNTIAASLVGESHTFGSGAAQVEALVEAARDCLASVGSDGGVFAAADCVLLSVAVSDGLSVIPRTYGISLSGLGNARGCCIGA